MHNFSQETQSRFLRNLCIDVLEQFFKDAGIPMTLGELNIDDKNIEAMASHACEGGRLEMGLVPLTREDVIEIYKNCL